jgi:hypothetical protein
MCLRRAVGICIAGQLRLNRAQPSGVLHYLIMRPGLGHRVVWYMGMNILAEYSWSIITTHLKVETVCSDGKSRYPPCRLHGPVIGITWRGGGQEGINTPPIFFKLGIVYLVTELNNGK